MYKSFIALAALAAAASANAQVVINFNTPTPDPATSQVYTGGGLSVMAYGYSSAGHPTDLYGKSLGGDENGVGLEDFTDHEINGPGSDLAHTQFIQLDVSSLLSHGATGASFFMNSTTSPSRGRYEFWNVYGSNSAGSLGTYLFDGRDEGSTHLHSLNNWWGTGSNDYRYFSFSARGTCNIDGAQCTAGNVLLGGLSIAAVPEPSTWGMMLLGFGALGYAVRRQRKTIPQIA